MTPEFERSAFVGLVVCCLAGMFCCLGMQVSEGVNGLLLEHLAMVTGHVDPECVEFFRKGAPFLGVLPRSGIGDPCEPLAGKSLSVLRRECQQSNAALVGSLREAEKSQELFDCTEADAKLGRMSPPVPFDAEAMKSVRLSPRFAVEKVKADGSTAIRPVDHFSWGSLEAQGLSQASFA